MKVELNLNLDKNISYVKDKETLATLVKVIRKININNGETGIFGDR